MGLFHRIVPTAIGLLGARASARASPDGRLERQFALAARGTSLRTEVLAGATTFLTMAYIVVVNPAILGQAGMPVAGVAAATCLAAALASVLMGLIANVPLAMAPGMGLNAYFAFTVCIGMKVPWPVALACVFLAGALFLVLTFAGIRQMIVAAIPPHLFAAVAAGIGLFIGEIGLRNAGVVVNNPATGLALGDLHSPVALLAVGGLVLVTVLRVWRVRAAILIGIAVTTAAAWLAGMTAPPTQPYALSALGEVAGRLDFAGVFAGHGSGVVEILFVFLFVGMFDNLGTLMAVTRAAGMVGPRGKIPALDRMLVADSLGAMIGAVAGTSIVCSYVESAAGVEAGGRTGLAAVVTGLLFLAAMLVAPYAGMVPEAATAPALILVAAQMMAPLAEIRWSEAEDAIPAFLTVAGIPLTFSIANGLAIGLAAHALIRLARGRITRRDGLLLVLAGLFVARFVWLKAV
ncbi:MAG: NCS2 family permease [Sphingomonadales bacterium]|nr:NCS2 family permease [Sphingomonadales bacterium]